jgi:hypothetical protein
VGGSGRVRVLVLVLVSGGVVFLLALGFLVRSCTNRFRSADPEQNDGVPAENRVLRPSAIAARSPQPVGAGPDSGLRAPQLGRGLIEQPDVAPTADAGTHARPPDLTDEQARALEVRRNLAAKDKLKVLERRRP